jgi:Holliday junction resolvase RusA-like endonuclease
MRQVCNARHSGGVEMTYKLTIPGRLPGMNEINNDNRTHWAVGAKHKKELTEGVAWIIRAQFKKQIGKAIYSFKWIEPNERRDPDNISAGGRKVFFDAMQSAGYIANDGWKQVAGFGGESFEVDKLNPRVEITIEEVNP